MLGLGMGLGLGSNVAATSGGGAPAGVALVSTNGTDKNANVTLSNGNLTAVGASTTTGTFWGDRADTAKTGKRQFEITIGSGWTGSYVIYFGIDDGSANFGTATTPPTVGIYGMLSDVGGASNIKVYYNGVNADSITTPFGAGDKIALEYDTVGGVANFYLTHGGTTTLLGGPYSSLSISTCNKAFIGIEGTANVTVNFGATAFSHTLSSGYSAYST